MIGIAFGCHTHPSTNCLTESAQVGPGIVGARIDLTISGRFAPTKPNSSTASNKECGSQ